MLWRPGSVCPSVRLHKHMDACSSGSVRWNLMRLGTIHIIPVGVVDAHSLFFKFGHSKGLKVNSRKTKVMVSAVGAAETRKAGKHPSGVCGKGVDTNSILCTKCRIWIHKQCNDVKGRLAATGDDFTCRKCKGSMPRPNVAGDGEFFEVEGEMYGWSIAFATSGICSTVAEEQRQQLQHASAVDGRNSRSSHPFSPPGHPH